MLPFFSVGKWEKHSFYDQKSKRMLTNHTRRASCINKLKRSSHSCVILRPFKVSLHEQLHPNKSVPINKPTQLYETILVCNWKPNSFWDQTKIRAFSQSNLRTHSGKLSKGPNWWMKMKSNSIEFILFQENQ